jgi:hypothetical protein
MLPACAIDGQLHFGKAGSGAGKVKLTPIFIIVVLAFHTFTVEVRINNLQRSVLALSAALSNLSEASIKNSDAIIKLARGNK